MDAKTAYPLCWPPGRPRTKNPSRSKFKVYSFAHERDALLAELRRMGARELILSSNLKLRLDGLPLSGQAQPHDCGVAIYFAYKGREVAFACDRWWRIEENISAVRHTIEALRGIYRWGTGDMVDAAFSGFAQLPAYTPPPPWRETLGLAATDTLIDAECAYSRLAMQRHPDRGGSEEQMQQLNAAIERARKELK